METENEWIKKHVKNEKIKKRIAKVFSFGILLLFVGILFIPLWWVKLICIGAWFMLFAFICMAGTTE